MINPRDLRVRFSEKLGVSIEALEGRLNDELSKRHKVEGAQVYLGSELRAVIDAAEKEMAGSRTNT